MEAGEKRGVCGGFGQRWKREKKKAVGDGDWCRGGCSVVKTPDGFPKKKRAQQFVGTTHCNVK